MAQIPKNIQNLFWDIDIEKTNLRNHPAYAISRILELGDEKALAWLKETFSEEQIMEVIKSDRKLSRRSANFWSIVYGIPRGEIAALAK